MIQVPFPAPQGYTPILGALSENPLAMGLPGPPFVMRPLTPMRAGAIQVLEQMKRTTAPVTVVGEVDMTNLIRLRAAVKPGFERESGIRLTYTPFFARAAVKALQAYPMMNAVLGPQGFVIPRRVDLGVATQVPGAVLMPTIRNAERKSIPVLAREIHVLGQRARTGQIGPADMDCTFAITNTGRYAGSVFGTPTIKPPNTGILAFETIRKRPVVTEGDRIEVRPMMYLALTADHRTVDAGEMTGFLGKVKATLENLTF